MNSSSLQNFSLRGNQYHGYKSTILERRNHLEETKADKNDSLNKQCDFENASQTLTPSRTAMPMSERQQIALLMQMSSPSPNSKFIFY